MKRFSFFRYVRRFYPYIFILTMIGTAFMYKHFQSGRKYTASAKIEYENADDGLAPDGTEIDTGEITNTEVITKAAEELGISESIDRIRAGIKVTESLTDDEKSLKKSSLDNAKEYTKKPTQYIVTFTADNGYGADYTRKVLDAVLDSYFKYYGEKHANKSVIPDSLAGSDEYDFIEKADNISSEVDDAKTYLKDHESFRSTTTGKSFADLYDEYSYIDDEELPSIYASIYAGKYTLNLQTLTFVYNEKLKTAQNSLDKNNALADAAKDLASQYSSKMEDSYYLYQFKDKNTSYSEIIDDVINGTKWTRMNSKTTYDKLVDEEMSYRVAAAKNQKEIDHITKVLNIFSGNDETYSGYATDSSETVMQKIDSVRADLQTLYTELKTTVDDYNAYISSKYLSVKSTCFVTSSIDVRMYTMLAFMFFLILSNILFTVLGRITEIIGYERSNKDGD